MNNLQVELNGANLIELTLPSVTPGAFLMKVHIGNKVVNRYGVVDSVKTANELSETLKRFGVSQSIIVSIQWETPKLISVALNKLQKAKGQGV